MRLIASFLIFFIGTELTVAQSNTSSIFRFLEMTPTARSSGLGGNHVGIFDADFSLMHINPAYLNASNTGTISASYINFLADATMGFSSGAYNVDQVGTFGLGIRFVGYGEFDRLDENGNDLGNFSANDIAITGGYSKPITATLQAGAALDYIHSSYANFKSSAMAVSAGLFYQDTTSNFSAGISIRNVGAQLSAFKDQKEPLPLDVSVGISKKPEAFPFHLNLTLRQLNNWDLRTFGESEKPELLDNLFRHILVGGEADIGENMQIRLGYDHYLHKQTKTGQTFDLAGMAFGVGFEFKNMTFDVSRNSYSKLGGITRLSIKVALL